MFRRTLPRIGRLGLPALAATTLATGLLAAGTAEADILGNRCPAGSFCVYPQENFGGDPQALPARDAELERCVAVETGWEASSFINETGKPVTTYQDPNCSSEADFDTHPDGSQTPQSSYVVRAFKVWSH